MGLLVVQKGCMVGLAGSCVKRKRTNASSVILAVPYLTAEDLQSSQLPTGIPLLVRCHSTHLGKITLLKSYGLAAPKT